MHICHYCGKQRHIQIDFSNSESVPKSNPTHLPSSDAVISLSNSSVSSSNLSTAATGDLSTTTATNNLSTTTNPNATQSLSLNGTQRLRIIQQSWRSQPSGLHQWNLGVEDTTPKDQELGQTLINNIPPATVTNDKSLAAIFPFKLEGPSQLPLFSRVTFEEKPITVMYTDAKVDGHPIKLILDSDQLGRRIDRAASACIITADNATKTPIGEIDDFPFEVNGIITPIKVLNKVKRKGKEREEKNAQANNAYIPYAYGQQQLSTYHQPKLICVDCSKKLSSMGACCGDNEEYQTTTKFYCRACLVECFRRPKRVGKWDNTSCLACEETLLDKRM
ncbi:hypothetical protein G9A89_015703 [Geosiphon pyriformis]|nr:hypothetical protein G9A89_015703 [Geosiphon pyriformis]